MTLAGKKIIMLDRSTVVISSYLTSFLPGSNRIAGTLDSVVMVMASCLAVSVPRRKYKALDRNTVVTASWMTSSVPS